MDGVTSFNSQTGEATFDENTTTEDREYTITYTDEMGGTGTIIYRVPSGEECQTHECTCDDITINPTEVTLSYYEGYISRITYTYPDNCSEFYIDYGDDISEWLDVSEDKDNGKLIVTTKSENKSEYERNGYIYIKKRQDNSTCSTITITQEPSIIKISPTVKIIGHLTSQGFINHFQLRFIICKGQVNGQNAICEDRITPMTIYTQGADYPCTCYQGGCQGVKEVSETANTGTIGIDISELNQYFIDLQVEDCDEYSENCESLAHLPHDFSWGGATAYSSNQFHIIPLDYFRQQIHNDIWEYHVFAKRRNNRGKKSDESSDSENTNNER